VFRAGNRGRGFLFDTADQFRAAYPEVAWILLGDPLSTAVNSRGEPADTTGSFAFTHDPVDSEGALTMLINELDVDLSWSPAADVLVFSSVDFMPRAGSRGTTGDAFEVDYAYLETTPFARRDITHSVGKLDSVFGREYRIQESPDRFGVTPSLLFRYVGGHPVGVKLRSRFFDRRLVVNLAAANGASFAELMPFSDDVDRNDGKTASGRLSFELPLPWAGSLEVGGSAEYGVQSRQNDADVGQHQWGVDLALAVADLELGAELVDGNAAGGGVDAADSLEYRAFYGAASYRVHPWLGGHARFERRHALAGGPDAARELAVGDLEAPHRRPGALRMAEGRGAVFRGQLRHFGARLAEFGVEFGPPRVGHLPRRVGGGDAVVDEGVQGVLLAEGP
jgi:hypothetical protein